MLIDVIRLKYNFNAMQSYLANYMNRKKLNEHSKRTKKKRRKKKYNWRITTDERSRKKANFIVIRVRFLFVCVFMWFTSLATDLLAKAIDQYCRNRHCVAFEIEFVDDLHRKQRWTSMDSLLFEMVRTEELNSRMLWIIFTIQLRDHNLVCHKRVYLFGAALKRHIQLKFLLRCRRADRRCDAVFEYITSICCFMPKMINFLLPSILAEVFADFVPYRAWNRMGHAQTPN